MTVTIGLELARGTAARQALTPGTSWPAALAQLVGRNRRRYGGYVVHLAVVIGVIAIVGTSAYATSRTLVLAPGQTVQFHGYGLKLRGIESPITRSYISTEAVVDVSQGGKRIDTLRPSARTYLDSGEPTKQIAIRPLLRDRRGSLPRLRRLAAAGRRHDQGLRQSARQPALALRDRPRARLRHRHLARSARSGPAGAAHERGVRARSLMLIAVIVLLALAVAVVALVAWPLVRERSVEMSAPDARRLALLERRDAALQALQELDLDHQAGKLTDEDAERERQTLRDEAVATLAELEASRRRGGGQAARVMVQISTRRSRSRTRSRA